MLRTLGTFFNEIWIRIARFIYWNRRSAKFVVILGGPGAGKGTIADGLTSRLALPHLNMGNILRREISQNTPIGLEYGPLIKSGKFVPDKVIIKLLKAELAKPEYAQGAILDGIPRTRNQAKQLSVILSRMGNKVNRVVLLDVSPEDVLERLSLRRICANKDCGKTYHDKLTPPRLRGLCDICGSPLAQRDDDKAEVVQERLKVFAETFTPLRKFYETRKLLTVVTSSNDKGPEAVLKDVIFAIEEFD